MFELVDIVCWVVLCVDVDFKINRYIYCVLCVCDCLCDCFVVVCVLFEKI